MELQIVSKNKEEDVNDLTIFLPKEDRPKKVYNTNPFIEANTKEVSLLHLQKDCIIPVFSKDNESTISHFEFIKTTHELVKKMFPEMEVSQPDIRISHEIKGRIPSAIGKPAKELMDYERTIYYDRCAFVIEIPSIKHVINGNTLSLSIGGVRSYSQENLYSKKSLEKFKVFIGFKNQICTNLCISTDGFTNQIRIGSIAELEGKLRELFVSYDREQHLRSLSQMIQFSLSEEQFAHFIGKAKMYHHLTKNEQQEYFQLP